MTNNKPIIVKTEYYKIFDFTIEIIETDMYRIASFYKVITPVNELQNGDIILLNSSCHSRIVRIATPTEKTLFLPYSIRFNAYNKNDYLKNGVIEVCTINDLRKIKHHLTNRIRAYTNHEFVKIIPDFICHDCGNKGNPKLNTHHKPKIFKTDICGICEELKPLSKNNLFGVLSYDEFRY